MQQSRVYGVPIIKTIVTMENVFAGTDGGEREASARSVKKSLNIGQYIYRPGSEGAAQFHTNLLFCRLFAISGDADGALARWQMRNISRDE